MATDKLDTLFEPYIVNILQLLSDKPKRFGEIMTKIKNRRTLSIKLSKLRSLGLVETTSIVVDGKYMNGYMTTEKGKKVLKMLEKV